MRAMVRVPDVQLIVAGDGPKRSDLQRLSDDLRLRTWSLRGRSVLKRDSLIARSLFTVMPSHVYETFEKRFLSRTRWDARWWLQIGLAKKLVHQGETGTTVPVRKCRRTRSIDSSASLHSRTS